VREQRVRKNAKSAADETSQTTTVRVQNLAELSAERRLDFEPTNEIDGSVVHQRILPGHHLLDSAQRPRSNTDQRSQRHSLDAGAHPAAG
jgi:hypothetical protein